MWLYYLVSTLNVLSFFFIRDIKQRSEFYKTGFNAQCFELFLYKIVKRNKENGAKVSMLNVLSFFFMWIILLVSIFLLALFRCSMFWAFSLWNISITQAYLLCVSMLNILSFFFICIFDLLSCSTKAVSMLNVLSFFFIEIEKAIALSIQEFRRSTFWAFSLYSSCRWRRQFSSCFDAQCSELFLYELIEYASAYGFFGFDAQCSELFLYNL